MTGRHGDVTPDLPQQLGSGAGPAAVHQGIQAVFARLDAQSDAEAAARQFEMAKLDFAYDAYALGVESRQWGDLQGAERWLKAAVRYGADEAEDDLDDLKLDAATQPLALGPVLPADEGRYPSWKPSGWSIAQSLAELVDNTYDAAAAPPQSVDLVAASHEATDIVDAAKGEAARIIDRAVKDAELVRSVSSDRTDPHVYPVVDMVLFLPNADDADRPRVSLIELKSSHLWRGVDLRSDSLVLPRVDHHFTQRHSRCNRNTTSVLDAWTLWLATGSGKSNTAAGLAQARVACDDLRCLAESELRGLAWHRGDLAMPAIRRQGQHECWLTPGAISSLLRIQLKDLCNVPSDVGDQA